MNQDRERNLEARLNRLEQAIQSVRAELDSVRRELSESPPPADQSPPPPRHQRSTQPPPPPPPPKAAPPAPSGRPHAGPPPVAGQALKLPEPMRSWEYWLNKLGIGLLLFGVVFLFKYSIDQGWLTPPVRIAAGVGLGVLMIVLGLFVYNKKRHFATVLLGGGIATYYITGWASIQVLDVWSYEIALAFMIATTLLSFVLSLKQDEAILSLIAVAGGLATPFLLHSGAGSVIRLMVYTSLLILLSGGIYFYKGWRSLLWETIVGGWTVIMMGMSLRNFSFITRPIEEQLAVQGAIVVALLMFWAAPVARELLLRTRLSFLHPESIGFADSSITPQASKFMGGHVLVWTVSMPLVSLLLSTWVWSLADSTWGWITLAFSSPFLLVWLGIRSRLELRLLGQIHLAVGLVLVTTALALLLDGNALYMSLAAEAVALFLVHDRTRSILVGLEAHGLMAILAIWFIGIRLAESPAAFFWNADTIADLWLVLALGAVAYVASDKAIRRVYVLAASLALAGVFVRDLNRDLAFFLTITELVGLHALAFRTRDRHQATINHLLAALLALTLGLRLLMNSSVGTPVFNWPAQADLFALATAVALPLLVEDSKSRLGYRLVTHAGLLIWLWRELSTLPNGDGIVTVAWGLYGIAMLVIGLRKDIYRLRLVGLVTLLLVVGKLFLVDLARIETIWRILLFLSFGGVFLILSYYFKALWKPPVKEEEAEVGASRTDLGSSG